ncbi:MAG: glycosyltransferase [Bdellovibrionales bacterium]|nr:glycosyltransferase [Bdellovibrionales bacterium]
MKRDLGFRSSVEVSAIVSTYNAAQYMRGCLDDLVAQTHYQAGKAEILIIDCNSPANEGDIVREYQQAYPRITYVRITERETLAGAWNIGVKYAEGEFVTNANTDDRHHPECLERHAAELRRHASIDLVYADVFQSKIPNEAFQDNKQTILYRYKPYFAPEVLFNYQFGCQPMWRASVHDKIGLFNRDLKAASDYEFNYRFALAGCRAKHIQEPLGLFLERDDSLSQGDKTSTDEQGALRKRYISPENILKLYESEGWEVSSSAGQLEAFHDLSIRASGFEFPWHPGRRFQDPEVALVALTAAIQLDEKNPVLLNNLAATLYGIGQRDDVQAIYSRLQGAQCPEVVQQNIVRLQAGGERVELQLCMSLTYSDAQK